METSKGNFEQATLGAGCFWCVEAIFKKIPGVNTAVSGYMGGIVENPSYNDVCTGSTQHAEVVQISFDPEIVSYEDILEVFWNSHDPTTLNRQGADVGTQYRSAIFYHSEDQQKAALLSRSLAQASGNFENEIVTEISPASQFFPAEKYHQDFYDRNPTHQYCQLVIKPKLEKLNIQY